MGNARLEAAFSSKERVSETELQYPNKDTYKGQLLHLSSGVTIRSGNGHFTS